MSDPAKYETARADYLRSLAIQPGEALARWGTLGGAEQAAVVLQMSMFYDRPFANTFLSLARKGARAKVDVVVTNAPRPAHTPKSLKASGYALQPGNTTTQYWVHPSGSQVWLVPPPKAVPPTPAADAAADEGEDPADLIESAESLVETALRLFQQAGDIKRRKVSRNQDAKDYYRTRKIWWGDYDKWKRELADLRDDLDPAAMRRFSRPEFDRMQQALEQLNSAEKRPAADLLEPLEAVPPR